MNIALIAKKGGVGKSTAAVLLYEAFRHADKPATIKDWDAQGTSTKALESIGHAADEEEPEVVIYDTPPSLDHAATGTAVRSADLVLVVTSPSPVDLWEAESAIAFAKGRNPKAKIRVLLNRVRKQTVLGRTVDETTKSLSARVLSASLGSRECYQHAALQGWKALDSAAREEVLRLTVAVLSVRK